MRTRRKRSSRQAQQGFSLIEMLLTAFILAVGIMGLTLLQSMAIKGARGGKSLSTAVQVGETVLDQIEVEGRLTWLNATSNFTPAAIGNLQFVNQMNLVTPLTFTVKGETPVVGAPDPVDATPFYAVNFQKTDVSAVGAGKGIISDFTVTVTFSDTTDQTTNLPLTRTVVLTRRIIHA